MDETLGALDGLVRQGKVLYAGCSNYPAMAQLAVGWVLAQPAVTAPIAGATRPEQLDDAVAAVDDPLGADLVERLDTLTRQYRRLDADR